MPAVNSSTQPASRKSELLLALLFLLSLSLLNPWIRGDGVGYYAYVRAPLIQHNLDFTADYQHANESFRENRLDKNGQPVPEFRTVTGHLENHFTVGPAILWSPFLIAAHTGVLLARHFGSSVAADGFSTPYRLAVAFATALYGFFGLLLSFRLACKYVEERWALLATLAIWWASSLAVYMYFNPSWSHALSAFIVALFLWYWERTRGSRSLFQWILLGAAGGLMLDVYYPNAVILVVLLHEALQDYPAALRKTVSAETSLPKLLARHFAFALSLVICLAPSFLAHRIVYGGIFKTGYVSVRNWNWTSPALFSILFSADHGLFSWTPILLLAVFGIFIFWRSVPRLGAAFLLALLAFYYFMASYPDWQGISSYGNRFFVSLTPLFILGLAVFLERFTRFFRTRHAALVAASIFLGCFVLWNGGLMLQWGIHLIPARGPVSFSQVVRNQFFVVPRQLASQFDQYLFHRRNLMQQIENRDVEQLKTNPSQQ
ncbi:MAG TPA: hypothetical protein VJN93_15640 [Candidatus Acidoferrum sp.]|nr:hypothetical protein [Candidatus Acidoferrum sp.]